MDLAWISLAALLAVIVASCTTRVNPGALSIVFAWVIGVHVAPLYGQAIGLKQVLAGFPTELFLTLVGVTLLFTQAQVNGTLDRVARFALSGCRGNVGLMPLMLFAVTLVLASIGAGNIAAAALMAPMAMAVAARVGISAFLMTLMIAHGAVAGALSPFAPTGIIANRLMADRLGLAGYEWQTYANNLAANLAVAIAGYLLFGGCRLFGRIYQEPSPNGAHEPSGPFCLRHGMTLGVIGALIVGVVTFPNQVQVGMGALVGAVFLTVFGLADEKEAIRSMPWSVIVMVCGVTVLTALLEQTGGIDLFTTILVRFSNPQSVTGVIALVTGLVSVYSSTSGVVLPTFLPSVPGLVEKLGGGDPWAIASSINVGGHLVDVSPLSTIGALCVACAPASEDRRALFNRVLAWGLSMSLVGALLCLLFFGMFRPVTR